MLILRYEDIADWPSILADIFPWVKSDLEQCSHEALTHRDARWDALYSGAKKLLQYSAQEQERFAMCEGRIGIEFYEGGL